MMWLFIAAAALVAWLLLVILCSARGGQDRRNGWDDLFDMLTLMWLLDHDHWDD